MTQMEVGGLTLEALKAYKKANPDKFAHKFGLLDLDAIDYLKSAEHPDGFDLAKHRRRVVKALPKTPLLGEEGEEEDDGEIVYPVRKEVATNVDGGENINNKEEK